MWMLARFTEQLHRPSGATVVVALAVLMGRYGVLPALGGWRGGTTADDLIEAYVRTVQIQGPIAKAYRNMLNNAKLTLSGPAFLVLIHSLSMVKPSQRLVETVAKNLTETKVLADIAALVLGAELLLRKSPAPDGNSNLGFVSSEALLGYGRQALEAGALRNRRLAAACVSAIKPTGEARADAQKTGAAAIVYEAIRQRLGNDRIGAPLPAAEQFANEYAAYFGVLAAFHAWRPVIADVRPVLQSLLSSTGPHKDLYIPHLRADDAEGRKIMQLVKGVLRVPVRRPQDLIDMPLSNPGVLKIGYAPVPTQLQEARQRRQAAPP